METVIGRWTLDYQDSWRNVDGRFRLQQVIDMHYVILANTVDDSQLLADSGIPRSTSDGYSRRQLAQLAAGVLSCSPRMTTRECLYYLIYDNDYLGLYVWREGRRWYLSVDVECNPYRGKNYIPEDQWQMMTRDGMRTRQAILDIIEQSLPNRILS